MSDEWKYFKFRNSEGILELHRHQGINKTHKKYHEDIYINLQLWEDGEWIRIAELINKGDTPIDKTEAFMILTGIIK